MEDREETSNCLRCGSSEVRMIAGRVTSFKGLGYVNVFQCRSCGNIDHNEVPHEPPGKRRTAG